MKNLIITFFCLLLIQHPLIAQKKNKVEVPDTVYRVVDKMPAFPGGQDALHEYIHTFLNPDQTTPFNTKEGAIGFECIVEKNGKIHKVEVLKSLDPVFDENFINMFMRMPKWSPGLINNIPVRSYFRYTFNINYYSR